MICSITFYISYYFSSGKQRRDQAIELSYVTSTLSVLEFKKDIGLKDVSIRYGEHHDIADLYVILEKSYLDKKWDFDLLLQDILSKMISQIYLFQIKMVVILIWFLRNIGDSTVATVSKEDQETIEK